MKLDRAKTFVLASAVGVLGALAIGVGSSRLSGSAAPLPSHTGPVDLASFPSLLSPDWIELDRGPLARRWPAVLAWTGTELVVWGGTAFQNGEPLGDGAAYKPAENVWRELATGPLGAQRKVASLWTGTELFVWSAEGAAAAWIPADNEWREVPDWPLRADARSEALPVWTGHEIIDVRAGLALDPNTGEARTISLPPGMDGSSGIVWTGTEIFTLEAGVAYDPSVDSWWRLPETESTRTSVAGLWTGEVVVAVDHLMNSAAYDPATASWISLPDLPLKYFGCAPRIHGAGNSVVADFCGGIGLMREGGRDWVPVGPPVPWEGNSLAAAGGELYAWGSGLYQMDPDVLRGTSPPRRVALGASLLDLPTNWVLGGARLESPGRITVEAYSLSGATCRVAAIRTGGSESTQQDESLLARVATDTELIEAECSTPASARLLAEHILTP